MPKLKRSEPVQTLLSDDDLYLFNEGSHFALEEKLGAHLLADGSGAMFSTWAPEAGMVSVMGEFNDWDKSQYTLQPRGSSGIWEGFVPDVKKGQRYKFHIKTRGGGYAVDKADPYAMYAEQPPERASVIWDLDYKWADKDWMQTRGTRNNLDAPISIYELHMGSWRRVPEEDSRPLSYREMAEPLIAHLTRLAFTHVEFLPIMEHPFYGSWGYQTTGYFAPTSRYGTPQDFMYLVDRLHQAGFGVILDWVPSHFPSDEHGLAYFDGSHLYEHADRRQGFHPDWQSYIFNYGRHEVRAFLISSALFWLKRYHVDGLRVDAVASMLYLDYSRAEGEWIPNIYGGNENLEAISFLRRLNEAIYQNFPDVQTFAEESTSWPQVSRPTYVGGLGFGYKWDMGWMHDSLAYMRNDPVHRSFHHNKLTFRSLYAEHENFVLPLSHDEVVHGKGSLIGQMPGDDWQRFANLRLLYSYMFAQPGKKLLFMGAEFGQRSEWNHDSSLDWHLLDFPIHAGLQRCLGDLGRVYRDVPALHQLDCDPKQGMQWVDANDASQSCLTFLRYDASGHPMLAAFNFTPVPRENYWVGVPKAGFWQELYNSDAREYGGSGMGNSGGIVAQAKSHHGQSMSLCLTLPPLAAVFLLHHES